MAESAATTFMAVAFGLACVAILLAPLRFALVAYLLASQLDFTGTKAEGAIWPALNAFKGIVLPLILIARLRFLPLRARYWPMASRLWLAFVAYAALAIVWSPFPYAGVKMVWYLLQIPAGVAIMAVAWSRGEITQTNIRLMIAGSLILGVCQTYIFGNLFGTGEDTFDAGRFSTFISPQAFAAFLLYGVASLSFLYRRRLADHILIALAIGALALSGSRMGIAGLLAMFGVRAWYYITIRRPGRFARLAHVGIGLAACGLLVTLWVTLAPGGRVTSFAQTDGSDAKTGTALFRLAMYQATIADLEEVSERAPLRYYFGSGTASAGMMALRQFNRYNADTLDMNRVVHNEFLRCFYEWGFPGLALMAAAIIAAVEGTRRFARRVAPAQAAAVILPALIFSFLVENALAGGCTSAWVMASIPLSWVCFQQASRQPARAERQFVSQSNQPL